jgi:hypothetical protein
MVLINAAYTLKYKSSELRLASLYVFQYCEVFMINLIRISHVLPGWLRSSLSDSITKSLYISKCKQRGSASHQLAHIHAPICMWHRVCLSIHTAQNKTNFNVFCYQKVQQFVTNYYSFVWSLFEGLQPCPLNLIKCPTDYFCEHLLNK